MKKLLFVTIESEESKSLGLWKKNVSQMDFFRNSGFEVEYFHLDSSSNNLLNLIKKNSPIISPYNWKKLLDKKKIDILYIRYPMGDVLMLNTLKEFRYQNPDCKILIEIPTYPYIDELTNKLVSLFLVQKDWYASRKFHKYVDKIITFSEDKSIWGIPTINVSNTVDFDKVKMIENPITSKEIELLAVATFGKWHGYDRVLEGLGNYYKGSNQKKVILHLVGSGRILHQYKNIVENNEIEEYVKFHGPKNGTDLDEMYEKCDIALDSMGRHRSNVFYNSTLKGKEYGAKGLPIVSGVRTELDSFPNFEYYYRVPADDSPIDINSIIEFYNGIYLDKSKPEVINIIRKFNEKYFNTDQVWKEVIDFMNQN